jgi:hypothetical protein
LGVDVAAVLEAETAAAALLVVAVEAGALLVDAAVEAAALLADTVVEAAALLEVATVEEAAVVAAALVLAAVDAALEAGAALALADEAEPLTAAEPPQAASSPSAGRVTDSFTAPRSTERREIDEGLGMPTPLSQMSRVVVRTRHDPRAQRPTFRAARVAIRLLA